MTYRRRDFLQVAAAAAVLPFAARVASADDYPSRPVRLIVGFRSGGSPRSSRGCSASGCRSGSASNSSSKTGPAPAPISPPKPWPAPPDGYTLLLVSSPNITNPMLYDHLQFDFARDIAPVAIINRLPHGHGGHSVAAGQTVPEFIAYAKANPGKINMASTGSGNLRTCRSNCSR